MSDNPWDFEVIPSGKYERLQVFKEPMPPSGLTLTDFKEICKIAESNPAMYLALEQLKFIYRMLK